MKKIIARTLVAAAVFAVAGAASADQGWHNNGGSNSNTNTLAAQGSVAGGIGAGMGDSVAGAAGGIGFNSSSSSAVNGSFGVSLNGPGSINGTYTSGNQSFATQSLTFGSQLSTTSGVAQSALTGNPTINASSNGSFGQSGSTGLTIQASSGSENFGSENLASTGSIQARFNSNASGQADAKSKGFAGEAGVGGTAFGSVNGAASLGAGGFGTFGKF